jgi:hypothetical protein
MSSPTGLYSGGLRWVDPPGAAAVSVKPSDGAGPGPPENSWGAPPLSPAVRGRLLPQPAADARATAVGRRGPWATGRDGAGRGAPGLSPVKPPPAWRHEQQRCANTAAIATAGAGWDRPRRPARGEAGGTKLGGRGGSALPWVLCQSELHRRLWWCRVRTVVCFISLEQRKAAATWCTTRLARAECTMIVRLTGRQCRYRKLPSGMSRPRAGPIGPGCSSLSNRPRSAWVFEACSE